MKKPTKNNKRKPIKTTRNNKIYLTIRVKRSKISIETKQNQTLKEEEKHGKRI